MKVEAGAGAAPRKQDSQHMLNEPRGSFSDWDNPPPDFTQWKPSCPWDKRSTGDRKSPSLSFLSLCVWGFPCFSLCKELMHRDGFLQSLCLGHPKVVVGDIPASWSLTLSFLSLFFGDFLVFFFV